MNSLLCILLILSMLGAEGRVTNSTYWDQRKLLLEEDYSTLLGRSLNLSSAESIVDTYLKEAIQSEIDDGFVNQNFPPSKNFMLSKGAIEATEIFSFIKDMPKGAVLHCHDTSLTSLDFVIQNITYWDNLYICYQNGYPKFRFSPGIPTQSCEGNWTLVSQDRTDYGSDAAYDQMLIDKISIVDDNPHETYPDVDAVWQRFGHYFEAIDGLFTYRPAFETYLAGALSEFMADGVMYFEFRGTLPPMYELDGSVVEPIEAMAVYENIINNFTDINQDNFFGARFIYAPMRHVSTDTVSDYVSLAAELKAEFNETVAGFDLVGQEDKGLPLIDFIEPLLEVNVPVFFHAGETNWYGTSSDENIADALLLNTRRLGHAYAIVKHPALMKRAIEEDIPIEISPISNQVLNLVEDLRNHPGTTLVNRDVPLVISSDDPAAWRALPLSHDFYEALMAFGGRKGDLRFLKQLALNSIRYSSHPNKVEMEAMWTRQWYKFINNQLSKLIHRKLKRN